MNSYTFHITFFDFAFVGTLFTGLTFAFQLWFVKSVNRAANRFLALALLVMVLWIGGIISWIPFHFSLAFGPLLYFFVLKLTKPGYRLGWRDSLHFGPVLGEICIYIAGIAFPLQPVIFISVSVYLFYSRRLIRRYYDHLEFTGGDRQRRQWRWLHRLLTEMSLAWLLWVPYAAAEYFYIIDVRVNYTLDLILAAMLVRIGVVTFLRPQAKARSE
ncbi:MAG: hypothetical protein JSU01_11645, partial [Bacteroidetes bacterium]|nr:hypothetical protein [Bacteroidota bacterium]